MAETRKAEKREDIIDFLQKNYIVKNVLDFSNDERVLEGTGSMIFDFIQKSAFACRFRLNLFSTL